MANNNNNSMSFNMEGSDDRTFQHLPTLVSLDYVRVENVSLEIDDEIGDDRNETDDDKDGNETEKTEEDDEETDDDDDEETDYGNRIIYLFGTVIVTDCRGELLVYHTNNDMMRRCLHLPLPQQISLDGGPARAISGNDTFTINVNFWVLMYDRVKEIIKEIGQGDIVWDPYTRDPSSYDKPLQQYVSGKYGRLSVGYSVITHALSATIDVLWMSETRGQIYGSVKAVRFLGESSTTLMLFDTGLTNERVDPGKSIFYGPFYGTKRFPFPVQRLSRLTIEVDLRDRLMESRRLCPPDDPSIRGTLEFTPDFGTQKMIVAGKYRKVQVSITCELPKH